MGRWLTLPSVDLGHFGNIEKALIGLLYSRMTNRLARRFGGVQQCPYCQQCAQAGDQWYFDSETDPTIDALHCGVCGGVSRWRFEMGMIALNPNGLSPPPAKSESRADIGDE